MWLVLTFVLFFSEKCSAIGIVAPTKLNQLLQLKISNGLIQGKEERSFNGVKYFSYVGIPYAEPPINDLRFRAPVPISNWSTVLDATVPGPCCAGVNLPKLTGSFQMVPDGEEDCLYLDVYTPRKPTGGAFKKPLAVMVFFYGGGFISGCAKEYGPDFFIENDVVLVVPNFRISVFGFLSTEDMESPGNWATKDQIEVLKWVKFNIKAFGGDSKTVTIFGQSAGAANVNMLLLAQRAKGLFHRAIMISGCSLGFWSYQVQPRQVAFDIGVAVGIETNDTKILMEKLRQVDFRKLIESHTSAIMINMLSIIQNGLPFAHSLEPMHQQAVLMDYPYQVMEKGEFSRVPVMMGVTTLEAASLKNVVRLIKPLLVIFNLSPGLMVRFTRDHKNRTIVANKIKQFFFNTTDMLEVDELDLLKYLSDDAYYRPMRKAASLISKHNPVYFYQFSYKGQLAIELMRKLVGMEDFIRDFDGVAHTEDIAYLFRSKLFEPKYFKKEMKIIKKMTKIYTNFAKYGNPTPIQDTLLDNVTWPRVTSADGQLFPYIDLGERFKNVVSTNFDEENFQFWNHVFQEYADEPYITY
ncbi:unnamed protein product [Ceutorhynchus assimilis]|uniref:Carboxylic ester hydrolase n=1 Tax=Ceutorhynchus assimilis TaxID=467358 RepID=A0A9N9N196_9CUCU|nr:unnamed protein product [Ceutorhynchus assimilis]